MSRVREHVGDGPNTRPKSASIDSRAGPFKTLGIFVLFVIVVWIVGTVLAWIHEDLGVVTLFLIAPIVNGALAYSLRSWWWLIYSSLMFTGLTVLMTFDWFFGDIWYLMLVPMTVNAGIVTFSIWLGEINYNADEVNQPRAPRHPGKIEARAPKHNPLPRR